MQNLVPELSGFTPRASTSKSSQFAVDPTRAGPGPSSRRSQRGGADPYWDEEDELEYADEGGGYEEDQSEDETDAEDEYAAATQGGAVRRGRKSTGGLVGEDGAGGMSADKGKGRADDQDLFALDEEEGDEDLGRLISAIRNSTSTGVGGATALDREFDKSIADELDAFDPDLMEDLTVGVKGRRRKRGKRGGRRRAAADIEPSPEVKRLLGQANTAYAEGSLVEAIELLSEVVRIDPIIRVSWYTLATIYEELEDREKAVQCKIVATHLLGSQGAADWADLGRECRDIGLLHQAIYCFTQAIKGDKEDVDAMWDRAILLKLSGATNMAIRAFFALLSLLPHDPGVLRELSPLLASTEQYPRATSILLSAFTHYRELVPIVTPDTVTLLNTYGYADLETLADFLLLQRNYAEVMRVVRQGVRWLQGRAHATGWDDVVDDREYDEARKSRPGWEKANVWCEETDTYELDVRLRSRLGLARLGMGMVDEAQRHFELVTAEDVAEFPELFGAIGQAYLARKMYDDALAIYLQMADNEETNSSTVWFKVGQCYQAMGQLNDAKECFENVVQEEPNNLEAKLALAKCLELFGDPQRALVLIKEVIAAREASREASVDVDASGKPRRRAYLSREERAAARMHQENIEHERHAEFQIAFSRLQELDAAVLEGDEDALNQWLEIATGLVDSFRSTKQLFPSDYKRKFTGVLRLGKKRGRKAAADDVEEEADHMATRLQRTLIADEDNEVEETSFRGLDFDGWVDFVLKYCFRLTLIDEIELAAEVLLHIRDAGVFRQDESREQALRLGLTACYMHAGMHEQAQKEVRWFLLGRQYQTEPVRFLHAVLSKHTSAIEAYNDGRLSKFFLRLLRGNFQLVDGKGDAQRGQASSPVADRKGKERAVDTPVDYDERGAGDEDEDVRPAGGERFTPTQLNPVLLLTYGHMLLTSLSYQNAIIYYLRAYELDKKQPLINLSLATAYLQRAMSRKTDNRQHQIAQAFAFLEQYRKLRGDCAESEYNLARAFHHLGLQSLAVKHYEKVLASAATAADRMPVDDGPGARNEPRHVGVVKAAAYNLALLYGMTGTPELARKVVERWLAV